MRKDCEHFDSCPLRDIISLISKKWTIIIINAICCHKQIRFNKLIDMLPDISPKTLSDTLKELEAKGLISRESFAEIPPRVEYTLTGEGVALRDASIPLMKWTAARNGLTDWHNICQGIPSCGKKWFLLVANAIDSHEMIRFNGLMDVLPGISPKTLSDTLKELEAESLIKRESFAEIPHRVEYMLTEEGIELRDSIMPLLRWIAARNGIAEWRRLCHGNPSRNFRYTIDDDRNTVTGESIKSQEESD